MKTAREIIAGIVPQFVYVANGKRTDGPDAILSELTNAGYQIVPPGGIHGPTREAAAKVALAIKPKGGSKIIDIRRDHAHDIASAIRTLSAGAALREATDER